VLGADESAPNVQSRRTGQEKAPWKSLPGIEGRVEREFIRPVLLGESILPYRVWRPFEGVVPVTDGGALLDAEAAATRGYSGLPQWMRAAEMVWNDNAESGKMTLIGRWNYHNELGAQFPIPNLRVVYAASGTLPAATILRDERAVVEHKLYWHAPRSEAEACYLAAVLNSETGRSRVAGLQSRGQWGARDFDKVMFTQRHFALFDDKAPLHLDLAAAGREAEALAAQVELSEGVKFQRARRLVRDALTEAGLAQHIDALVARLLDGGA
jgi:hypothetical protein